MMIISIISYNVLNDICEQHAAWADDAVPEQQSSGHL